MYNNINIILPKLMSKKYFRIQNKRMIIGKGTDFFIKQ